MQPRVLYLRVARISCDHPGETRRQAHGRLSVAGATIERQPMPSCQASNEIEKRIRIKRPVRGVERSALGEMILEIHARESSTRGTATPTFSRGSNFD